MPAVTVENPLTLPRVPQPAPGATSRRVLAVTTAPEGYEGEGFPVRRAFAGVSQRALDPFIHMDQMGEVEYAPGEPKGTAWHPHRGFETVTYMIDGEMAHQDSHGGGGLITNGDTQWMTAGAGILHIETPPEHLVVSGGLFHGLQLWVNLPKAQKFAAPRYQDITRRQGRAAGDSRTAARWSGSSRARSPATPAPGRRTPRSRSCTPPSRPARRSRCRGGPTSTPSSTPCPATARSAPRAPDHAAASSRCSAPATPWSSRPTAARTRGTPPASTCSSSAAGRSASRSSRTARS